MQVTNTGSVRVDLVGGTLDLEPINLILPNVVTLNVATSLKAKVEIEEHNNGELIIESLDYDKVYKYQASELTDENLLYSDYFKEMSFVLQILNLFDVKSGMKITLSSGAPAGSGLGGSSAMGVTLYKALDQYFGRETSVSQTVLRVKGVEGRILNQGVPGYQDYYPALTGGVLALRGTPGEIECEQLYTEELKVFLENHITLIYSGISRDSGINNWDVYKSFFDQNEIVREGLSKIAKISFDTYQAIKNKNYTEILSLIGQEGESRKTLSANIVPKEVETVYQELLGSNLVTGLKMCGAGGGGCFILTHDSANKSLIAEFISKTKFKVLDFNIDAPLK